MKKPILLIVLLVSYLGAFANWPMSHSTLNNTLENDDPVLFTFGKEEVKVSEFAYVYEKQNSQDGNLYSQKSVDEYLDLYIKFKLKVKEAEMMGLDTNPDIARQLDMYRKQLSKNYIFDKNITEELVEEAYDRMNKEVRTSHLLLMLPENAPAEDTLRIYNTITDLRKRIVEDGEDFAKVAKQHSQDPSVKDNNGDLGYISCFQTVYPFESAAYNTSEGEVSQPVRTKYGYHLVKVDDIRKAQGMVQVSHILIKTSKKDTEVDQKTKKEQITNIAKQLEKDKKLFPQLAKQFSDDKTTARNGGKLKWFGSGEMLEEFEENAFALKEVGDISEPFKTKIGWHIMRLEGMKKVGEYEDERDGILKKIAKDSRSRVSKKLFLKRLKTDYAFTEKSNSLEDFMPFVDNTILAGRWRVKNLNEMNKTMFTITLPNEEANVYTQKDFAAFIQSEQLTNKSKSVPVKMSSMYNTFVEQKLLEAEESQLEVKHPDFARLMKEFRDGTLLFDLTEQKIWKRATEDTTGLERFFDKNKDNYQWKERVDSWIINCPSEEIADKVNKLLKEGKDIQEVEAMFNVGSRKGNEVLKIRQGTYEKGDNPLLSQLKWKAKSRQVITNADGSYSVVQINKVMPAGPKKLAEAKGFVVADYQKQLEAQWIEELKEKYPVSVKEETLKTLYKAKS